MNRQGTALTGLSSLSDLDLQLISIHHELGGHAKSARCNLLDAGGDGVPLLEPLEVGKSGGQALLVHVCQMLPAKRIFTALTRVALACMMGQWSQIIFPRCKILDVCKRLRLLWRRQKAPPA